MYKRINELFGTEYNSDSKIDWNWICIYQRLSESFIREFQDKVDWTSISFFQNLSESFIKEFKDKISWRYISSSQTLSESFIREFQDEVNWESISYNQVLSESFIREFKDEINWEGISANQLLSWDFILEFEDKVDWYFISKYQPFIDSNYEKINKEALKYNELYHLYQQTKERGWFVGYIDDRDKFNSPVEFVINNEKGSDKVRIYWSNLIYLNKALKHNFIRLVKVCTKE